MKNRENGRYTEIIEVYFPIKAQFHGKLRKKVNMWSNCLIESWKQFIRHPTKIRIIKRGSWLEIFQCRFPHFYWLDKRDNKFYHFSAKYSDEPFLYQLWFQGKIKRFLWHNKKETY